MLKWHARCLQRIQARKKRKVLIVFDYMIADMISNKKLNLTVTTLCSKSTKLNISLVFIIQSYFKVSKDRC